MPDRFTLLTLSFYFILHNVCSWSVSEPLNHTLNDDGSVSVTCVFYGEERFELEAKLKMNDKDVCEVYDKRQEHNKCKWEHEDNKFTFTLMKPEALHSNTFSCEISKIKPYPVETEKGPKIKLFRGCSNPFAPPKNSCLITSQTHNQDPTPVERPALEDTYTLLICGLVIVVIMLCLYSIILTAVYIRLRVTNLESSDTLTYVPMQRNVKRRDLENTEYVDMREVQKREGSHRDMNHNSHLATVRAHF
ncbi:uncharacterized protein LOC107752927 [Sinocyclocheilus rhinocerous]|uniref:uncharacterized protein LOC107752927 n=1 Tax=Sinocyclocheilus rhinocerous TaxID=307959 RepID=UPI0007B8F1D8|nr:PREDICTED: uncharacterized protein LOC107752927 [Sinocyclocheilus rhinocerous]